MDRGETPRTRPAARRLSHGVRGDLACGLGFRTKAGRHSLPCWLMTKAGRHSLPCLTKAGRLRSPLRDLGDGPGGVFGDEGVGVGGGLLEGGEVVC